MLLTRCYLLLIAIDRSWLVSPLIACGQSNADRSLFFAALGVLLPSRCSSLAFRLAKHLLIFIIRFSVTSGVVKGIMVQFESVPLLANESVENSNSGQREYSGLEMPCVSPCVST